VTPIAGKKPDLEVIRGIPSMPAPMVVPATIRVQFKKLYKAKRAYDICRGIHRN
jgi:hypothetical protein